jgi:hypothetical protein
MGSANTCAGSDSDPLARAASDIRKRCGKVEVYWDEEHARAASGTRKLKVMARDLPLVFPVEDQVLAERGKSYEAFLDGVAKEVDKVLRGQSSAPPSA